MRATRRRRQTRRRCPCRSRACVLDQNLGHRSARNRGSGRAGSVPTPTISVVVRDRVVLTRRHRRRSASSASNAAATTVCPHRIRSAKAVKPTVQPTARRPWPRVRPVRPSRSGPPGSSKARCAAAIAVAKRRIVSASTRARDLWPSRMRAGRRLEDHQRVPVHDQAGAREHRRVRSGVVSSTHSSDCGRPSSCCRASTVAHRVDARSPAAGPRVGPGVVGLRRRWSG